MKKVFLLSSVAALALAANAQYTCNPETSVVAANKLSSVEYLILPDASVAELQQAGAKCTYIGPDDVTRFLYIWENTMNGYDASMPGPDMQEGTYASFNITNPDWFGAGYFISKNAEVDFTGFNEETRFHIAYMTPSNSAPSAMYLTILDGDAPKDENDNVIGPKASEPAQVSIGTTWKSAPLVAPAFTDDWQGIDISFADLKKLCPSFSLNEMKNWAGNVLAFGGDAAQGRTFSLDNAYFYNLGDNSGVSNVAADKASFLYTGKTVNLNGASGIELYNLNGQLVKKTNGSVLGTDSLNPGVYMARSGKTVCKIIVK